MTVIEIKSNFKEYDPDILKHLQSVLIDMFEDFIKICDENNIQYFLHAGTCIGAVRHEGFIPWDDEIDVAFLREDYEKLLKVLDKPNEKYYISNWKQRFDIDDDAYTPKTLFCLKNTKLRNYGQDCNVYNFGIYIDLNVLDDLPTNKIKKYLFIKMIYFSTFLMNLSNSIQCDVYTSRKNEWIGHRIKFLFKIFNIPNFSAKIYTRFVKKYHGKSNMICSTGEDEYIEKPFPKYCFDKSVKGKFEVLSVNLPNGYDETLKIFYGDYMEIPPVSERFNHNWDEIDFGDY